jgi:hypothetical protein
MALTDEERRHLDDLAEEMAAELASSDPVLVQALTEPFAAGRRPRILVPALALIAIVLAVVGVLLEQPLLFAAGGVALAAAGLVSVARHRHHPRP